MNAAERLRTRLRWTELSSPAGLRISILATYTAEPLVPYLGVALHDAGLPAEIQVGPYHQIEQQCLDDTSVTAGYRPDVLVVAPRLEELWAGMPLPTGAEGPGDTTYTSGLTALADICLGAADRWRSHLVLVLPPIPRERPAGVGDDGAVDGVAATAVRARELARTRIAGHAAADVVDADEVARALGTRNAYHPGTMATARIPFTEEFFAALAGRLHRSLVLRRRAERTVLLVDAARLRPSRRRPDEAGDRGDQDPASPMRALLADAASAGAEIVFCGAAGSAGPIEAQAGSPRDVAARFAGHRRIVVTSDPEGAALALESSPDVAVWPLPAEPELWADALNDSGLLDSSVRPAAVAEPATTPSPTLESFVASLRVEVDCSPLPPEAVADAADLSLRVSEFHMTGAGWRADQFVTEGTLVWGVRVRDRFGDHGLSGVVAAHVADRHLILDHLVLTCPVLGRGVEAAVLAELRAEARRRNCEAIRFRYRPAGRNDIFRRFLAGLVPLAGDPTGDVDVPVDAVPQAAVRTPAVGSRLPAARIRARRNRLAGARTGDMTSGAQVLAAVRAAGGRPGPQNDDATDDGTPPRSDEERSLAGVFAEVLGRESVGVNGNFFALGGDSMLAVQLISRCNRSGMRLTLPQVFQHQTVAGLATVVTRFAEARHGLRSDEPVPLLPGPAWFFGLDLPNSDHFNQSLRFRMPSDVDVAALRRAASFLAERHPALRMRFTRIDGVWRQVDAGVAAAAGCFRRVNLGDAPPESWDSLIAEEENSVQRGMRPAAGRLFQFVLFDFGRAREAVLLTAFHHLAIDGVSWRLITDDFQQAYEAFRRGEEATIEPVGTSVLEWALALHAYAQSPAVLAELPRWLDAEDVGPTPVPADNPDGYAGGAFTHRVGDALTVDETEQLSRIAVRDYQVTPDVLLLTAAATAVRDWTGRSRIRFDVVNHGREAFIEGIDISRTVGWLTLNVPILFDLSGTDGPGGLVPLVGRQLRAGSGPHDMGDNLLRYLCEDPAARAAVARRPAADLLFSYAGRFDAGDGSDTLLGHIVEGPGGDMDPGATTPYAVEFDAIVLGGRLRLQVYYREARHRAETATKLLQSCMSNVRALIEGTDLT